MLVKILHKFIAMRLSYEKSTQKGALNLNTVRAH